MRVAENEVQDPTGGRLEVTPTLPRSRPLPPFWREKTSWALMSFATDAVMLAAAGLAGELASPRQAVPVFWTIVFSLLAVAVLHTRGMYKPQLHVQLIEMTRAVVTACALAAVIAISLRIVLTNPSFVAAQSARMWLFATAFLAAGRISLTIFERPGRASR